jgi:L-amino acid N-acyltransferase YncA
MDYTIRHARDEDKNDVIHIFNYYIENSYSAFFEKRVDTAFFDILKDIAYGNSFYVIEHKGIGVIGFGLLKIYHNAEVFSSVAELGYFIKPEFTHKGLGTLILDRLIKDARIMHIKTLLASISSLNEESINFHKKHDFYECGRLKGIGQKHGKTFDVIWMQRDIYK